MKQNDCLKLRPRTPLTVLLDQLDLTATKEELRRVKSGWRNGVSVGELAEQLKRDPDEVAIMVMHLARQMRIGPRPGGAYGGEFNGNQT